MSQCIKCGSSDKPHVSRELCKSCYDKDIEKRHKDNERTQNYGGSSKLLTAEYLAENYINQNKSLADIAKETNGKSAPRRHPIPVHVGTLFRNMPAGDSGASRQVFVIYRNDLLSWRNWVPA